MRENIKYLYTMQEKMRKVGDKIKRLIKKHILIGIKITPIGLEDKTLE